MTRYVSYSTDVTVFFFCFYRIKRRQLNKINVATRVRQSDIFLSIQIQFTLMTRATVYGSPRTIAFCGLHSIAFLIQLLYFKKVTEKAKQMRNIMDVQRILHS